MGTGEEGHEDRRWDTRRAIWHAFAGVGRDFPVIQDIVKMYQAENQEVPEYVGWVYYNRGVRSGNPS